jgi:predicted transcriptional regulator
LLVCHVIPTAFTVDVLQALPTLSGPDYLHGMVADRDYIVRKLVRVSDGRVKPGHDGGKESVFSASGIIGLLIGRANNRCETGRTAQIVSAHVSNNAVTPDDLPSLIQDVYKTLAGVGHAPTAADRPQPAVPIKRSVIADHIVCLEDGKKLKMLKRHLMTAYQMTPSQYRERWGLAPDSPMVAPDYARQRSSLARQAGLGTRNRSDQR